jgi:CheY-like chemotaxis protein
MGGAIIKDNNNITEVKPITSNNVQIDKIIYPINKNYTNIEILIVDDSPVILKMTDMILKKYGFKTIRVDNGKDAIKIINHKLKNNEKKFNFILLDTMMPDMDGYLTAKEIRKIENNNDKNYIIGFSSKENITDKENFDNIIYKPFTISNFIEIIDKVI